MPEDNLASGSLDAAAAVIEQRWEDAETETEEETVDAPIAEDEDEAEEVESESDADEEVEESEAPEEDEEEDTPIETVADLAEALNIPVEELLQNFKTKIKVDGETAEVTLQELTAGYQKDADYRQKTEALSRDRQALEELQQQEIERWTAEHQANAYIVSQFEQAIVAEMQSPQLSQLRQENETAWLARRQELQDQLNGLERVKAEAAQRWDQTKTQLDQQAKMQRQQMLAKENELLHAAIPSWDSSLEREVTEYLVNAGVPPERLQVIDSHLDLVIAHKAMLYDKAQAEAEVTAKKVKQAPKLQKPSKKKSVSKNDIRNLKARVRKTGNIGDAAAAIEQMI